MRASQEAPRLLQRKGEPQQIAERETQHGRAGRNPHPRDSQDNAACQGWHQHQRAGGQRGAHAEVRIKERRHGQKEQGQGQREGRSGRSIDLILSSASCARA